MLCGCPFYDKQGKQGKAQKIVTQSLEKLRTLKQGKQGKGGVCSSILGNVIEGSTTATTSTGGTQ